MNTGNVKDRILGVVLCGGKSSRMGSNKSLLPHSDGGRFIDHAIDQLQAVCAEVCIAGAANEKPVDLNHVFLHDNVAFQGPITGIISALQYASDNNFAACLVTPVDMPCLTHVHLTTLKSVWTANRVLTCAIDETNRLQPLIACYPIATLPLLKQLALSDDRSLYRWIATQPHQTVLIPSDAARNVNAPDDL
ncbi:molybdenum cofactor guanylyltransferase [Planctomycetes bacterium K23_9]|uniref:molybdenum cofactor guanylyltransferase n=1 Tax=Stieleria marina TaxID=1930275 RepID=UPI0011A7EA0B